jgi:hypothetical protein
MTNLKLIALTVITINSRKPLMVNVLMTHKTSGVGKTTLASKLLQPRLGARLISVSKPCQETAHLSPDAYECPLDYYASDVVTRNSITDVPSCQFFPFIRKLSEQGLQLFDYIIVPCDRTVEAQIGTVETIKILLAYGVNPNRIRLIFNKTASGDKLDQQFSHLFEQLAGLSSVTVNSSCYVPNLGIFDGLLLSGISWEEVLNDKTDHVTMIRALRAQGDEESARFFAKRGPLKLLQTAALKCFDDAYSHLCIETD